MKLGKDEQQSATYMLLFNENLHLLSCFHCLKRMFPNISIHVSFETYL